MFSITTDKNVYKAKKVVVATGGKSFQTLGASDIGLSIAKSFGIGVKEFTPALAGLTLQKEQFWMKNLYFIGEVVDVTGEIGGYNFQWAFSSGYVCATSLLI